MALCRGVESLRNEVIKSIYLSRYNVPREIKCLFQPHQSILNSRHSLPSKRLICRHWVGDCCGSTGCTSFCCDFGSGLEFCGPIQSQDAAEVSKEAAETELNPQPKIVPGYHGTKLVATSLQGTFTAANILHAELQARNTPLIRHANTLIRTIIIISVIQTISKIKM